MNSAEDLQKTKWELIVPRDRVDTTSFFMDLIRTRNSIGLYWYTNFDGMEIADEDGRNIFGNTSRINNPTEINHTDSNRNGNAGAAVIFNWTVYYCY